MAAPLRLLIVDESQNDVGKLLRELKHGGFDPVYERVVTAEAMSLVLKNKEWDVVVSDCTVSGFGALAALAVLRKSGLDLPFIVVSSRAGEDVAVQLMEAGAHDCIMKKHLGRLVPAVVRELRQAEARRERKQIEEAIQRIAFYDALTDLPNRALFCDRLQQATLSRERPERPVALLLMDLDGFKDVNNTLGHQIGDRLLQGVGRRLRTVLVESNMIARTGGDEFAVLFTRTDQERAIASARTILKALDQPFVLDDLSFDLRGSVGIAICPDHGQDSTTLMRCADVAMYSAKHTGRGFSVYQDKEDHYSARRLKLMGELNRAVRRGELVLHYQPKVRFSNRRTVGVEALARWNHPQLGVVQPEEFIPLGEHTPWIKLFTAWVVDEAVRQCSLWHEQGLDLSVAMNLSVRNLLDPYLVDGIKNVIRSVGLPPEFLTLEITESSLMNEPEHAKQILTRLGGMGVRFTIDDFGTGYSSLVCLKRLPVNGIKIDKSFVKDMAQNDDDHAIIRSTIELGHNLGLEVIAEGVEDRETWEKLSALGCDTAQGYFFSSPLAAAELANWLAKSPWGCGPKADLFPAV